MRDSMMSNSIIVIMIMVRLQYSAKLNVVHYIMNEEPMTKLPTVFRISTRHSGEDGRIENGGWIIPQARDE